jgi:hypothetical protein
MLHEVAPSSFIYEFPNALPHDVRREMIRRFEEKTDQQYPGHIGQGVVEAVFPPFWTHIHRAVMVETEVKYIATTWICFA